MLLEFIGVVSRNHHHWRRTSPAAIDLRHHIHAVFIVVQMIVRQDQVHCTGSRIQLTLEILKGHRRHHLAVPTFEQGLHALANRLVIVDHPDPGTAKTTIERRGSILVGTRLPGLQFADRDPDAED